jgi:hypothetical protein
MKKTFVIVSVSDRVNELNRLIESIMNFSRFNEYDINLLFQDDFKNADQIWYKNRYANIFIEPEKMGCNGARVSLLKRIKYDIYINLDDDILLTPWTNYDLAIEKALQPSTGFVLTNWARTEKLLMAKVPNMKNAFVKQIMVYQGGGMVYSDKIAELIRKNVPIKKTVFDDIWPITAYVNGYTNYRFLGSLAIHRICTKGGMHNFMRANSNLELSAADYINYTAGKKEGTWLIPMDNAVNSKAHELHKLNLKR